VAPSCREKPAFAVLPGRRGEDACEEETQPVEAAAHRDAHADLLRELAVVGGAQLSFAIAGELKQAEGKGSTLRSSADCSQR